MPDGKDQPLATPLVLHDAPLRQSDTAYFHFDEFARTLARLIANKDTRTPLPGRNPSPRLAAPISRSSSPFWCRSYKQYQPICAGEKHPTWIDVTLPRILGFCADW